MLLGVCEIIVCEIDVEVIVFLKDVVFVKWFVEEYVVVVIGNVVVLFEG